MQGPSNPSAESTGTPWPPFTIPLAAESGGEVQGQNVAGDRKTDRGLRGTSKNASAVEVRAGKGPFRPAKGVAKWSHRPPAQTRSDRIVIRALNAADTMSAPVRVFIRRN